MSERDYEAAIVWVAATNSTGNVYRAIDAHVADLKRQLAEAKDARRERDELKAGYAKLSDRYLALQRSKPLHYDLTGHGIKVCTGEHMPDQPCEWVEYVEREK